MVDIFLSYSSKDRSRVKPLGQLLQNYGWDVWWDQQIPIGKTFDKMINEAISNTKCVIVIWSKNSVESNWVKEEASIGSKKNMLVPVLIDRVPLPLGFSRLEAANLVGWQGELDHSDFELFLQAIERLTGKPRRIHELPEEDRDLLGDKQSGSARPSSEQGQPKPPIFTAPAGNTQKSWSRKQLILTAVAIIAVLGVVIGGIFLLSLDGDNGGIIGTHTITPTFTSTVTPTVTPTATPTVTPTATATPDLPDPRILGIGFEYYLLSKEFGEDISNWTQEQKEMAFSLLSCVETLKGASIDPPHFRTVITCWDRIKETD